MQRNLQAEKDKLLLAWQRERRRQYALSRQRQVLDEPIQRGWVRRWRLTSAAKLRPDAAALATILKQINTERRFWRRDFKTSKRCSPWRRLHLTGQSLNPVDPNHWKKLGWPASWRSKYFGWKRWPCPVKDRFYLAFRFPDLLQLYTDRYWITEMQVLNPDAGRQLAELDSLIGYEGERRLSYLTTSHKHWKKGMPDKARTKFLQRIDSNRIHQAYRGDAEAEASRELSSPSGSRLRNTARQLRHFLLR